jgi:hypothetical protein
VKKIGLAAGLLVVAGAVAVFSGVRAQDNGLPPPAQGTAAQATTPAGGPPAGTTRYIVGGDARDDLSHVVPWAFKQATARGASAFFFLGDMELTPSWDSSFQKELNNLKPMPFYPAIGNHEVTLFGTQIGLITKIEKFLDPDQIQKNVDKFTKNFVGSAANPVPLAPLKGQVAFGTNVKTIHWVSLDNVSQPGFGPAQLEWLEGDLKAASADPSKPWIVVGMHKALYGNGTTTHAMGDPLEKNSASVEATVIAESNKALALFQQYGVKLVIASHEHLYAKLDSSKMGGIESYITGGMGAPLKNPALPNTTAKHHILQLDSTSAGITVTVLWFDGTQTLAAPSAPDTVDGTPAPAAPAQDQAPAPEQSQTPK